MMLDVLRWDPDKHEYVPEKKPKLQPACQVPCADGMVVLSDTSPHVKQARAAVQEMLLLQHPVDCPICDQAGECRLQDYWLEHQRSPKRMLEEVVHKPKGVVFGPTIVYDAERCILCTRCIRVCKEVALDPVLSMRERGNLKEICVSSNRELAHDYTLMTEHVCPVGALTSRDFRFKARVWFLRTGRTICQGCATGCHALLDYDPRTNEPYRLRPRECAEVNGHWMCDAGMLSYPSAVERRLLTALVGGEDASVDEALEEAKSQLAGHAQDPRQVAFLLSAQHSVEDNLALVTLARQYILADSGEDDPEQLGACFFLARQPSGRGDAILMSEDKNPNAKGCESLLPSTRLRPMAELLDEVKRKRFRFVIGLGAGADVDPLDLRASLPGLDGFVLFSSHEGPLVTAAHIALPTCSWAEAAGTYVNRKGRAGFAEAILLPRGAARPAWELIARLGRTLGYAMSWRSPRDVALAMAGWSPPPGDPAPAASAQPTEAQP
jgi:NADH-quinone oxidoreductase subunit G